MRSRSSSAAWRPTSGLAPAPRPLVTLLPSCSCSLAPQLLDRLRVGVGGDEFHAFDAGVDHVRDRVAAAAAHADDLDDRVGCQSSRPVRNVPCPCPPLLCIAQWVVYCHCLHRPRLAFRASRLRDALSLRTRRGYQFLQLVEQACPPCPVGDAPAGAGVRSGCPISSRPTPVACTGLPTTSPRPGDVLRNADAHRHVQHFFGQFDHAFHASRRRRSAPCRRAPAPRSRSGAVRPAPSRRFPRSAFCTACGQRLPRQPARRTVADARHLDAFLGASPAAPARRRSATLICSASGVGVRSMCAMSLVTWSPAIGSDAVWRIAPCTNTAMSVVPAPMSTSTTPSSRSSAVSTAVLDASD